ncbi:RUS1 family protein C16orf58 homolog [Eumeta japonica]|uniref:RUS1 family protein C16orf58 homolog n=1 Tax=Eumeta variegata TaxID=151549 RepID=A0A4C1SID3_EUMVA|nr:RUS1 family protein C16orf58 homolog [Eumeta japonica]
MSNLQEGELLLIEKYAATEREICYVRPPGQTKVVIVEKGGISVLNLLSQIFLPHGYPDSVSKDYLSYQIWDTAQAFCSTITGILATQEVFRGVGVGDTNATPLAATVTWVMKDGCGHLGRILFAYTHGTYLDAYSKKWRLYADVLNDAAMCMEIALPLFKNYITFVLCVSTVMKAIVGVAGSATRAAMTQHHALSGNIADVSAKDSAQETFVNLIASLTALVILTYIAVRAVCLRTLNKPRFLHVIDTYLRKEVIPTPCEVNQGETIVSYGNSAFDLKLCGFHMKLGCSLKTLIDSDRTAAYLKSVKEVYAQPKYILIPKLDTREMYILFKTGATTEDILSAFFHGTLTAIIICAINDADMDVYLNREPKPFLKLCHTLRNSDWGKIPSQEKAVAINSFKYLPSIELLTTLGEIFDKEWLRMKSRLEQTGWDLSKHLLIVDEWRLHNYSVWNNESTEENLIQIPMSYDEIQSYDKLALLGESLSEADSRPDLCYQNELYGNEEKTPKSVSSCLKEKLEDISTIPNPLIGEQKDVYTFSSTNQ